MPVRPHGRPLVVLGRYEVPEEATLLRIDRVPIDAEVRIALRACLRVVAKLGRYLGWGQPGARTVGDAQRHDPGQVGSREARARADAVRGVEFGEEETNGKGGHDARPG